MLEVLKEHGIQLNDEQADGGMFFSGDMAAFKELTGHAASERPDDGVDLWLAYMATEPDVIA